MKECLRYKVFDKVVDPVLILNEFEFFPFLQIAKSYKLLNQSFDFIIKAKHSLDLRAFDFWGIWSILLEIRA